MCGYWCIGSHSTICQLLCDYQTYISGGKVPEFYTNWSVKPWALGRFLEVGIVAQINVNIVNLVVRNQWILGHLWRTFKNTQKSAKFQILPFLRTLHCNGYNFKSWPPRTTPPTSGLAFNRANLNEKIHLE